LPRANNAGADDALLDTRGFVADKSDAAFIVQRRAGHQPVACLKEPRATVIEICARKNSVKDRSNADDVYHAKEMFCTGTMGELAAVTKIDNRTINDGQVGPMTKRLSALYGQRTATEGARVID
jgi:branched-chain amino acid aminotransferase